MTTLVGTQNDFYDALFALCELDYDAIEAYKAAINRLENEGYKQQLLEFMHDHERHVREITMVLEKHQQQIPKGPDMKQYLTQGKVVLSNILGDKAILRAMLSNEVDTNSAYERVSKHTHMWTDALTLVEQGLNDEKRHKQWLEDVVATN